MGGLPSLAVTGGKQDTPPEETARVPGSAQKGQMVEAFVTKRIRRSESVIQRLESRWRELWAHFDGDQYVERSAVDGTLVRAEVREGGSKPRWRSRLVRNRFTKAITGEVSVVGSRTPVYEVTPPNADKAMRNKARLGEKVLIALHQKLKLRQIVYRVCQVAAVTGDGYCFPHWDPTKGQRLMEEDAPETPLTQPGTDTPEAPAMQTVRNGNAAAPPPPAAPAPKRSYKGKRTGDISIKVLRQDQVGWQPNCAFDESRYWVIRDAQPVEDVRERVRVTLGEKAAEKIKADASAAVMDYADGDGKPDLVFVYLYLERPSDKHPEGRYIEIANGLIISDVYPYPLKEDIPCLHRMPWILRENRDRSLGIGEMAIDIQRSINRIVNQIITWRNLVLAPQMVAPKGSVKTVLTDEPLKVIEYRGPKEPKWREIQEIPVSLFKDLEQAYADMDFVAGGSAALPVGVESGAGIQGVNEREQSFRAQVISNLATFYSGLGRHLLCLVKQHYTEERLLVVNGRFGVDMIADFLGSSLGEEDFADVRVSEASITPRTRAEMEAKIMMFADKQWIPPQMAMAALQGGTADAILDRFERDEQKAYRHIAQLVAIGQGKLDPDMVPHAGPQDNHAVQADVIKEWMKTVDFEEQHEIVQILAFALIQQHDVMAAGELDQEAARTAMRATAQGAQNAGKPQEQLQDGVPPPAPSRPSMQNETQALAGVGG